MWTEALFSMVFFASAKAIRRSVWCVRVRSDDMVYSVSYKTVPLLKTTNNDIIHLYAKFSHRNFLEKWWSTEGSSQPRSIISKINYADVSNVLYLGHKGVDRF